MLLLGGCSSGDYVSGPTSVPPGPATTTTGAPEVTVRGVIAVFSPSARVLTLAQPNAGFATVALAPETQIVRAGGAAGAVGDLVPGAAVEATGRPSGIDTLVAGRVVLL